MRHISAILLASFLTACGSTEQPDTPSPMPYMDPASKVTFMSVDEAGKAISQDVDGATFNRLLKSRLAKQAAYQRGEPEPKEQAQTVYVGNAGPGCVASGCPDHPYAICLDSDVWLYNMNYGYSQSPWDYRLIIGCFRGSTWSPQLYQPTFSNPASTNQDNWAYGVRSSWAGVHRTCWSSSTDFYQAPTIPTYCSQPYEQRDFGTWYGVYQLGNNNTPRALVRMYQYP